MFLVVSNHSRGMSLAYSLTNPHPAPTFSPMFDFVEYNQSSPRCRVLAYDRLRAFKGYVPVFLDKSSSSAYLFTNLLVACWPIIVPRWRALVPWTRERSSAMRSSGPFMWATNGMAAWSSWVQTTLAQEPALCGQSEGAVAVLKDLFAECSRAIGGSGCDLIR